uniref:Transmembrane domain-containing protein n=1 Tax=Caenorhabditis tropicalis TaxID=1561998 RepID=A0A1I7UFT9_9PELO
MKLHSIACLIVLISVTTFAQQQSQCDLSSPEIKSMKPKFGGISGFYGIAKGISDGLQNTPDSKTYNDLNNLIFGSGAVTYNQVITDMVVNQIGAIVFWSFGFVFVLAALVLGIATCIWQCCYTCVPKETSVRSEITGYVYAFLLFTVFSFILTGLILFNVAETDLINSVDNGMIYANQINGDLNAVITNGSGQITCEVTATTTQTFSQLNVFIGNYSDAVVDGTKEQVGITAVNNFDDVQFETINNATKNAGIALSDSMNAVTSNDATCKANIQKIQDQFSPLTTSLTGLTTAAHEVRVSPQLQQINQQTVDIKKQVQTQADSASVAINSTQDQINESMNSITTMLANVQQDINNVINSLESGHRDLVGSSLYSSLKIGVRLAVTIPACIGCCFCIIAFISVLLSLKQQDGLAIKLSSAVLSAFYSTITISITLLLFSSVAFVLGWFTSAMCVPIFEDPNYQLFHLMNQTIPPVANGNPDVINIGEVLHSCNNPSMTIYTAINGSTVVSAESINQQLNLGTYRDKADDEIMQQQNLTFTVPAASTTAIQNLNDNTANVKSNPLTSYRDRKNNNDEYFNRGDATINASVSTLMGNLQQNVFKCRPLVDIYNNGGDVMCEQFGKPIQGLWAAIGLSGIFLFFLSILLLLTFRWLKTNSKDTAGSGRYDEDGNGTRKLGDQKKSKSSEEYDIFSKPVINSASNTGRRLPRVQPYDMDVVVPSEYEREENPSQSYFSRVQVLPDERHEYVKPNYFDTQDYGTRTTRFADVDLFDHQSNNGSTARGLRRC